MIFVVLLKSETETLSTTDFRDLEKSFYQTIYLNTNRGNATPRESYPFTVTKKEQLFLFFPRIKRRLFIVFTHMLFGGSKGSIFTGNIKKL